MPAAHGPKQYRYQDNTIQTVFRHAQQYAPSTLTITLFLTPSGAQSLDILRRQCAGSQEDSTTTIRVIREIRGKIICLPNLQSKLDYSSGPGSKQPTSMNTPPIDVTGDTRARMQVVTVFDPDCSLRTHQVTGVINLPAFRGILQSLYTSRQFDPDMNALWDLRQADFSRVMPEDVRALMHVVVSTWQPGGKCHSAILVSNLTDYGVARIYVSQFGTAAPCKIKVFMDAAEALKWLGITAGTSEIALPSGRLDTPSGA